MKASANQTVMGGLETPEEEAAAVEAEILVREELFSAIRTFINGFISGGQKGYVAVANILNKRWEPHGRPVTEGVLRSSLSPSGERNYFRAEWLFWFQDNSAEVAEIMARKSKPDKTDRQLLEDFIDELAEDLSHKRIQAALRRARAK